MDATIIARTPTSFILQVEVPYNDSMLDFEETLQRRLNEAGVVATAEGLRQFDTDGAPVTVGSVKPALCRWLNITLDKIGGLGNCSFSEPVELPPIIPIRRRLEDQCHADKSTNIGMTQNVSHDASIDTEATCDIV